MEQVAQIASAAGILLTVVQYWMNTMIPLRMLAISTNILFLIYASLWVPTVWPTVILNCIVLPLNVWRLFEMQRLVREAESASRSDLDMSWLQPFMSRRRVETGEILFHKGEVAHAMYLVASGRFALSEINLAVPAGTVVGELGMLAPERRRTLSLVCLEAGDVFELAYDRFEELYFQNPGFGLNFLKLTTGRLFQNINRLENELAALKSTPPAIS